MATHAANKTRFTFTNAHFDAGDLQIVRFAGHEAVSQLFRFELDLVSKNPSVAFSDLVNQPATLALDDGQGRYFVNGIVADFEQGSPAGEYFTYRAVLVPRLWRLTLTRQSRIFQHLSVPEVVTYVLQEIGLASNDVRFELAAAYAPREYCTQFQETDLAFVSRLLEHEGIHFFFVHEEEREVLVITDDRGSNPPIEGAERVIYRPVSGFAPGHEDTVQEFAFREQIVTGKVVLKDYNYLTPEADLSAESQISDELSGTHYEHDAAFEDVAAGSRLARIRNEEIEAQRWLGRGEGTCMRLRAGHRFTLDKHYRLDLNRGYLLTEVRHVGSQRSLVSMELGEDTDLPYRNTFICIPADVPFRPPRRTPEPRIPGIMTAHIESDGGEYAHLDEHGRYRARMSFDLRDSGHAPDAEATLPIRMSQPYSGPGYGIHFPNHAGTEMIWACVNGDPNRPLALGTVPNPSQESPSLGENRMQSIIRTASGHELVMDDTVDQERILLQTPKAHRAEFDDLVNHIRLTTAGGHTAHLSDDNKQIVLRTGAKEHQIVMEDTDDGGHIHLTDKDGKLFLTLNVTENNITIVSEEGNIQLRAPKGNIELESKALKVTTTEGAEVNVGEAMKTTIGDDATLDVGGKAETTIGGDASTEVSGKAETSAGMEIAMTAGTEFKVSAGTDVKSEAGMNHESKGLNVKAEAAVQNEVKGSLVTVQASGVNTIQGAVVKIN